jgi:zinc protease
MHPSPEQIARLASQASGHLIVPKGTHTFAEGHPIARFTLDNGLVVVLAIDPRAPIFCYQTWFRVGSKNEDPNLTGIAHLFEHLMFKGTTTYESGVFDREMGRRGGQTNAATWVDWTYYTQALAARADNLQAVIDFESDRMVNLIVDDATFKSELEVVKNERRMAVDDSIGGSLSEALMALSFKEHPYRWPTIGSMAHLEATSVNDLRAFYRANYAPNNAVVVITGDLDPVDALTRVARAYGKLSSQAKRPYRPEPEPTQTEERQAIIRRQVLSPQMVMGFAVPPEGHPDHYALEMLTDILTEGDTGRLHRRLVTQERSATDVSGFITPWSEPGLLELHIQLTPQADPTRAVACVHEELRAVSESIEPHELNKARYGLTLAVYDGLKDVEGLAEALGHSETNLGDFKHAFDAPERYAQVRPEDLMRVARDYLSPHQANLVTALPLDESEET